MSKIMQVTVMKVLQKGVYKGANFILQRMGNAFQYMIFWEDNWYQSYFVSNPSNGKEFTHQQEVELAMVTNNFMETTVDTLVATKAKREEEAKKKKRKVN